MSNVYNALVALNTFWNGFDIPAFEVSTIPDNVEMPYITYEGAIDDFGYEIATNVNLYYRGKSWKAITEKLDSIESKISKGVYVNFSDNKAILIRKANPFAQRVTEDDEEVRRYIINLSYEFII